MRQAADPAAFLPECHGDDLKSEPEGEEPGNPGIYRGALEKHPVYVSVRASYCFSWGLSAAGSTGRIPLSLMVSSHAISARSLSIWDLLP